MVTVIIKTAVQVEVVVYKLRFMHMYDLSLKHQSKHFQSDGGFGKKYLEVKCVSGELIHLVLN